jgi:hypothetical protein
MPFGMTTVTTTSSDDSNELAERFAFVTRLSLVRDGSDKHACRAHSSRRSNRPFCAQRTLSSSVVGGHQEIHLYERDTTCTRVA